MTTSCNVKQCGNTRGVEALMCPGCWYSLPIEMRRQVLRAWKAWKVQGGQALWDRYKSIRAEALAAAVNA